MLPATAFKRVIGDLVERRLIERRLTAAFPRLPDLRLDDLDQRFVRDPVLLCEVGDRLALAGAGAGAGGDGGCTRSLTGCPREVCVGVEGDRNPLIGSGPQSSTDTAERRSPPDLAKLSLVRGDHDPGDLGGIGGDAEPGQI